MSDESLIQIFDGKNVRIVWNEQEEKYYFAVSDIVQVLTDTANPTDYLKKMRQRDKELSKGWGQIVTPLSYQTMGGKQRINFADLESIFRIIQSIPSKRAEPIKKWLAEVGAQRIDQMIDPELTFQMAVDDYRRQGYSDRWINERIKSIKMRKELTDEWERSGIHEQKDFALLTNILTKEISRQRNPKGFNESQQTAQAGGRIAKNARKDLEKELGHSVISPAKAADYLAPIEDVEAKNLPEKEN